jgi:hypothetical protein
MKSACMCVFRRKTTLTGFENVIVTQGVKKNERKKEEEKNEKKATV